MQPSKATTTWRCVVRRGCFTIIGDPEYRGRGVGDLLVETVLAELAARGAPRVVLMTAAQNEVARRLFVRAGFRPTMIEMTRDLDG